MWTRVQLLLVLGGCGSVATSPQEEIILIGEPAGFLEAPPEWSRTITFAAPTGSKAEDVERAAKIMRARCEAMGWGELTTKLRVGGDALLFSLTREREWPEDAHKNLPIGFTRAAKRLELALVFTWDSPERALHRPDSWDPAGSASWKAPRGARWLVLAYGGPRHSHLMLEESHLAADKFRMSFHEADGRHQVTLTLEGAEALLYSRLLDVRRDLEAVLYLDGSIPLARHHGSWSINLSNPAQASVRVELPSVATQADRVLLAHPLPFALELPGLKWNPPPDKK